MTETAAPQKKTRLYGVLALLCVLAAIGAGIVYFLPQIWAKSVPGFLHDNVGSFLVVDETSFSRSPPELVLRNVHLLNPPEFGTGDAIRIGQVNVVFADDSRDPIHIRSITVQDIKGKKITRGNADNFSALFQLLMDRKVQTPRGVMARKTTLQNVLLHKAVTYNEEGTILVTFQDSVLVPSGALVQGLPLQNVITDVLGAVINQQQNGAVPIAVENFKEDAKKTIQSIGSAIRDYLKE